MVLFVEYSLRCLELIIDAAKSQSCEENHSLSTMVSGILEIFAHWYNQQVVRKTNNATEATTEVPDQEYRSLLHQFVSACLSQSQYVAILHDAVYCKVKYIAEVVRSVLECAPILQCHYNIRVRPSLISKLCPITGFWRVWELD